MVLEQLSSSARPLFLHLLLFHGTEVSTSRVLFFVTETEGIIPEKRGTSLVIETSRSGETGKKRRDSHDVDEYVSVIVSKDSLDCRRVWMNGSTRRTRS